VLDVFANVEIEFGAGRGRLVADGQHFVLDVDEPSTLAGVDSRAAASEAEPGSARRRPRRRPLMPVVETRALVRSRSTSGNDDAPTSAEGLSRLADSDLLRLISRRTPQALEVVYDRYIDAAWTVALAYSDGVAAAERAVAAAFLHLWREPEPAAHASLAARLLSSVKYEAVRA